jgi:exosortase
LMFLVGGLLMFTGTKMTRLLLFPILYLAFMIPAPATVLDTLTLRIQLLSTGIAARMLEVSGYAVRQVGSSITGSELPGPLQIAAPCSGFRMLISLLTFTAFFVYMLKTPLWKKAVLVGLAFPLSVFVNGLRIAAIGWVGIWTNSAEKMHAFHNTWAMAFELVVSFAILFGFARLIRASDFGIAEPGVPPEVAGAEEHRAARVTVGRGYRGMAAILAFALVIVLNATVKPLEATAKGKLVPGDFAKSFDSWDSRDVPIGQMEAKELKTAAMLRRLYTYTLDDLPGVEVLVQAARDTDAFHDPHSCLPGNGSIILDEKIMTLKFGKPHPRTATATLLRATTDMGDGLQHEFLLLYWYSTRTESYATTAQVRWRMRLAQMRDIKDLVLHRTSNEDVRRQYAELETYCYRFTTFVQTDARTDRERLLRFVREFVANSKNFGS